MDEIPELCPLSRLLRLEDEDLFDLEEACDLLGLAWPFFCFLLASTRLLLDKECFLLLVLSMTAVVERDEALSGLREAP